MNLLKEGIEQRAVEKTAMTRKVTLDGITKPYPVYKVKLDWLFYNDQNDRIATWITQYKNDSKNNSFNDLSREDYNNIIQQVHQKRMVIFFCYSLINIIILPL